MDNSLDTEKPFIMYVDDDADDLEMVSHVLRSINTAAGVQGYQDAQSALEFLETIKPGGTLPSLMILDLNMPGQSGNQTLQQLKGDPQYRHIPVVIFTNSDYHAHRAASLAIGADDFITKPYNYQEIKRVCATFATYLDRPRQRK